LILLALTTFVYETAHFIVKLNLKLLLLWKTKNKRA